MATISFKGKPVDISNADGTHAYTFIKVPELARRHCDMAAFRQHSKHGGLANSTIFPTLLKRIRKEVFKGKDIVRLDQLPDGVRVDTSGFLYEVSFDV